MVLRHKIGYNFEYSEEQSLRFEYQTSITTTLNIDIQNGIFLKRLG